MNGSGKLIHGNFTTQLTDGLPGPKLGLGNGFNYYRVVGFTGDSPLRVKRQVGKFSVRGSRG